MGTRYELLSLFFLLVVVQGTSVVQPARFLLYVQYRGAEGFLLGLKKCRNLDFNPKANSDHLNSSLAESGHMTTGVCVWVNGGQGQPSSVSGPWLKVL